MVKKYFEVTEPGFYALHLDEDSFSFIAALLLGSKEKKAEDLLTIIQQEITPNDLQSTSMCKEIIRCETCKGSGFQNHGNLQEMHNFDLLPCHVCRGEGRMLRIMNEWLVPLTENIKHDFAQ